MNFKKPLFWNLKEPNFFSYLLIPFTIPFMINNFLLKIKKKNKFSKIKSICVGNIYLGGTGKTPLAMLLQNELKKIKNPVIIKKHYKDQEDEQNLIRAKKISLIVSKKRQNALRLAHKKGFGAKIIKK